MGFSHLNTVDITLLNLKKYEVPQAYGNIISVAGDATDLKEYRDKQFNLAFSNSVIEHVGGIKEQRKMAKEMMRAGKKP